MQHCKTRIATILILAAGAIFGLAALFALIDGVVSGRAFAVASVGLAVATAAIAVNTRQVAGGLAVSVERAPRDQYWRGYKERGEDVTATQVDDPDDR